jgi:Tfp pilus assembly protein PilF
MRSISSKMAEFLRLAMVLVCTVWTGVAAVAGQSQTGSISGAVKSLQGQALSGAKIYLFRPGAEGEGRTTFSGPDGSYMLKDVAYGEFTLTATISAFKAAKVELVNLSSEHLTINVSLAPMATTETDPGVQAVQNSGPDRDVPSFSASEMIGATAPSGYAAGASAAEASQTMELVSGLRRPATSVLPIREELGCESEDALLNAVRRNPKLFDANHKLGLYYLQHGRPSESVVYLTAAEEIVAEDRNNSRELAYAYLAAHKYPEAISLLERLIKSDEKDAGLHALMAEICAASGQRERAVTEFRLSAELDSGEGNVLADGVGLLGVGATKAAEEIFVTATDRHPSSARMWLGRGIEESLEGRKAEAVGALLKAASLDPDYALTYGFLVNLCGVSAETDSAIRDKAGRFVASHPEIARGHLDYGQILERQRKNAGSAGSDAEIEAELKLAIKEDPSLARAHFDLGVLYLEAGSYKSAAEELDRAVQLRPRIAEWHYRLFRAYKGNHQTELADLELKTFREMQGKKAGDEVGEGNNLAEFEQDSIHRGLRVTPCPARLSNPMQ